MLPIRVTYADSKSLRPVVFILIGVESAKPTTIQKSGAAAHLGLGSLRVNISFSRQAKNYEVSLAEPQNGSLPEILNYSTITMLW
jgi:hypothetical protein